jgi:O-antigen/teichoic acid export membrane protein
MSGAQGGKSMLMASVMMAGAAYLSYASGLLSSILVARTLGPHDYGVYAYIIWLAGVSVSIVNHGLPVSAIKFISEVTGSARFT